MSRSPDRRRDDTEFRRWAGLTLMIGRNDMDMTTAPADARTVVDAAAGRGFGYVGFRPLACDHGRLPGTDREVDACGGIARDQWACTRVAQSFVP